MSSLEDDIARIAAMRGRNADAYQAEARYLVRRIPRESIGYIFAGNPDPAGDIKAFDRLPRRSREFIRECIWPLNSGWWAEVLAIAGDEDAVIGAVLSELPYRIHDFILRHYGRDHPSARKLT